MLFEVVQGVEGSGEGERARGFVGRERTGRSEIELLGG